jgi:hypothetical protein
MDVLAADRHDAWNLMSLGALNVAHAGWWLGLYPAGPTVISTLFAADLCYILCDLGWLVFSPRCVAPAVWPTLIVHHGIVLCCVPTAWAKPVLMAHLLRTWIVEVHSVRERAFASMPGSLRSADRFRVRPRRRSGCTSRRASCSRRCSRA